MNITIFGAGYVGLSTAVCYATKYNVSLVDIDNDKIQAIKNITPLIYEEGLDELLEAGLKTGNLQAFHVLDKYPKADIVFIAVGTPSDADGYVNLEYVRNIVKTIKQHKMEILSPEYTVIVIRSTVIPGTTTRYLRHLEEENKIGIAFCPEFLAQGTAIQDTLHPNRVIIGTNTKQTGKFLDDFFKDFYGNDYKTILHMSIESAEFAKYAANALLATKISLTNELANIVEAVDGANIDDVMKSVGLDPRIAPSFLRAGIGFGGSCFPKDVRALIQYACDIHAERPVLLSAVLQVNENRPLRIIKLLRDYLGNLDNKTISVLGLAFKPGTNDVREAPALSVVRSLWRNGADIKVHDPLLKRINLQPFNRYNVQLHDTIESCVTGSHAAIFLTEWEEYSNLDLSKFTNRMKIKFVIDGRRIFSSQIIPEDVLYLSIGSSLNNIRVKNHLSPFITIKEFESK